MRVGLVSSVDSDEECAGEMNAGPIWCGWVSGPSVQCMGVSGGLENTEAFPGKTRPVVHRKLAGMARTEGFLGAKQQAGAGVSVIHIC